MWGRREQKIRNIKRTIDEINYELCIFKMDESAEEENNRDRINEQ